MNPGKILLIESDPAEAEFYGSALREAGYHVDCVPDERSVPDQVKKSRPDLILFDADNVAAFSYKDIPLVVLTSLNERSEPLTSIGTASGYIYKPCRARTFLETIEDVLGAV